MDGDDIADQLDVRGEEHWTKHAALWSAAQQLTGADRTRSSDASVL